MEKKQIKLVDLCAQVEGKLQEMGQRNDSIRRYQRVWEDLQRFCKDEYYDEVLTAQYLHANCIVVLEHGCEKFSKSQMYIIRAVRALSDFSRFGAIKRRNKHYEIVWPNSFREPIGTYLNDPCNVQKSAKWKMATELELKQFVQYLDRAGISEVTLIVPEHITGFTASLNGYTPRTIAKKLSTLRIFFAYLYRNELIERNLSDAIPKFRTVARQHLPTVWHRDDVEKIVGGIDRGNPVGKRNYAIILIAARLGLRVGDIKALQLSDIKWDKLTIEIVQSKTGEPLVLPILEDVGWAIIDYLKNGRPVTACKYVFLRHLAPFRQMADSEALYNLISECIKKAGIAPEPRKRIGIHSLRHSLATELLQQNISPAIISGVLGHRLSESLKHYARVDMDGLRHCALIGEVRNLG